MMLFAKFGWNCLSGSWEEDENDKSLQTDGQQAIAIRKAHLSFQLRWAKNVYQQRSNLFLAFSLSKNGCNRGIYWKLGQ